MRFLSEGGNRLADRLRHGDALARSVSKKMEGQLNAIGRKLNDITRNDLLTSISKYKQAIALIEFHTAEDSVDGSPDASPENLVEVTLTPTSKGLFKEAKWLADKAVNQTTLSVAERILAMTVLIKSTLLGMDNPSEALILCKNFLKEMHSWRGVQEDFKTEVTSGNQLLPDFVAKRQERRKTISSVCEVNRIVFDVIQKVGGERILKEFFAWPYIEIDMGKYRKKEKIDPLRDNRLRKALRRQNSEINSEEEDCLVVQTFGDKILKRPHSIATDSRDQFIVVETATATVFDSKGNYRYTLDVPIEGGSYGIIDVDTDRNDRVYLLIEIKTDNERGIKQCYEVAVVDNQGVHVLKFRLNPASIGRKLAVRRNSFFPQLLILEGRRERGRHAVIEVYKAQGGRFEKSFGHRHLEDAQDIAASKDDRIFVLDQSHHNGRKCVREFTGDSEPQLVRSFEVDVDSVALTFDSVTNHIVVVSASQKGSVYCEKVSIYQLSGLDYQTPVSSMELQEYEVKSIPKQNIVVTATGRIVVVLESIGTKQEQKETTEQTRNFLLAKRRTTKCRGESMGKVIVV